MAQLVTALAICEGALRKIGAYSPYDGGADQSEMAVAINRLDIVLAEMAGEDRYWWLVPTTQSFDTEEGVGSYDLNALLDTDLLTIERLYARRNGMDTELTLLSRRQYEDVADKTAEGRVCSAYIDRLAVPTIHLIKVPSEIIQIRVVGQADAPNVSAEKGETRHGFPKSWQRYLEYRLAIDLGEGPIRRIPDGELEDMNRTAERLRIRLMSYSGLEQVAHPRTIAYRDL